MAVVVDGGPQMVYFVVDGRFLDGGSAQVFGYTFFRAIGNLNAEGTTGFCSVDAVRLRMYDTHLRVSELISNFRAAPHLLV